MKTAEELLRQLVQGNCGCCDVREAKEYLAKTGEPKLEAAVTEERHREKPVKSRDEGIVRWFHLPPRVRKVLTREGMANFNDILALPRKELASIHGLGPVGLGCIASLELYGQPLKGTGSPDPKMMWQFLTKRAIPQETWDEFGGTVPAGVFNEAIRITVRNCDDQRPSGMPRYCAAVLRRWEEEGKW